MTNFGLGKMGASNQSTRTKLLLQKTGATDCKATAVLLSAGPGVQG